MRILVAEDERFLADLVAEGLREQAMAVDVAYDGAAALEHLTVNDYDVLVLDRDLPRVHGDEICRELTRRGEPVRILMLTASGAVHERVTGLNLGADDVAAMRASRRCRPAWPSRASSSRRRGWHFSFLVCCVLPPIAAYLGVRGKREIRTGMSATALGIAIVTLPLMFALASLESS